MNNKLRYSISFVLALVFIALTGFQSDALAKRRHRDRCCNVCQVAVQPVCCPAPQPVCCPAPVVFVPPPQPVCCPPPQPVCCPAPVIFVPPPQPICCPR